MDDEQDDQTDSTGGAFDLRIPRSEEGFFKAWTPRNPASRDSISPIDAIHRGHHFMAAEIRADGSRTKTGHNSVAVYKKLFIPNADEYLLRFRFKLDVSPPPAKSKHTGESANHALNVIVAFQPLGRPVLMHYVWDTDPDHLTGDDWQEELPNGIELQQGIVVYPHCPHIVARSSKDPLGKWIQITRDLAEDYRKMQKTDFVPPIILVAMQGHIEDGQSSAAGAIGDLELVRKKDAGSNESVDENDP